MNMLTSQQHQEDDEPSAAFQRLSQLGGHKDFGVLATLMLARRESGADLVCLLKALNENTFECIAEDPDTGVCPLLTMASVAEFALEGDQVILIEDYLHDGRANRLLLLHGTRSVVFLPVRSEAFNGVVLMIWRRPQELFKLQKQWEYFRLAFQNLVPGRDLERQLKIAQHRLSSILETIPQGVLFLHFDSAEAWMNTPARALLNLSSLNTSAAIVSKAMENLQRQARTLHEESDSASPSPQNWTWVFGDPASKVISVISHRLQVENTTGQLWVFQDVTEDYRQKQALLEQGRTLALANEELETFTASVTHDLRAPLRVLNGFSHALEEDIATLTPEEITFYLRSIQQNSNRMATLIDDLLSFSRLGRKPLEKQPVNMNTLVAESFELLDLENAERKPTLEIADLPPAFGDPHLLKQVWINLISNAHKYSSKRPDPMITIGAEKGDKGTTYFTRDNGVGFDMQHAAKLFGTFQRLHSDRQFEGTGMGLAIVRKIIQKHGGEVWAQAAIDQGATFFFTLPPADPLLAAAAAFDSSQL